MMIGQAIYRYFEGIRQLAYIAEPHPEKEGLFTIYYLNDALTYVSQDEIRPCPMSDAETKQQRRLCFSRAPSELNKAPDAATKQYAILCHARNHRVLKWEMTRSKRENALWNAATSAAERMMAKGAKAVIIAECNFDDRDPNSDQWKILSPWLSNRSIILAPSPTRKYCESELLNASTLFTSTAPMARTTCTTNEKAMYITQDETHGWRIRKYPIRPNVFYNGVSPHEYISNTGELKTTCVSW